MKPLIVVVVVVLALWYFQLEWVQLETIKS